MSALKMSLSAICAHGACFPQAGIVDLELKLERISAAASKRFDSGYHASYRFGLERLSASRKRKFVFRKCDGAARMRQASVLNIDVVPPPIDEDLDEVMRNEGAEFSADGIALTFHNNAEALQAAREGVAVVDLSHHGRVLVRGEDRARFLHNQTTADINALRDGEGCDTVLVNPQARTVDVASAWVMRSAILLVVSPGMREELVKTLDKYIFFADKVTVEDITERTCLLSLVGPQSDQIVTSIGAGTLVGMPLGTHMHFSYEGSPITVSVGTGLGLPGFQVLVAQDSGGGVWRELVDRGAVPLGESAWEHLRILQGRPSPGKELTTEYNVLEAGLYHAVSITKGCYMGQETVARLVTYDGVKTRLWGLRLDAPVEPGTAVTLDGQKVGKVTSYTEGFDCHPPFALAYIRTKAGGEGLEVQIAGVRGTVVAVPFLTTSFDKKK